MARRQPSCICLGLLLMSFILITKVTWLNGPSISPNILYAYDEYKCGCPRAGNYVEEGGIQSICSKWATSRGGNQSVVAYTIFGDMGDSVVYKKYYNQMEDRIKEVGSSYKGWIVRLYHNFSTTDHAANSFICRLYCKYNYFDPCQVENLYPGNIIKSSPGNNTQTTPLNLSQNVAQSTTPRSRDSDLLYIDDTKSDNNLVKPDSELVKSSSTPATTLSRKMKAFLKRSKGKGYKELLIPKMWRYLPMMDPCVDYFIIRDVDSAILNREVAAVNQWIYNSTAMLHAMRDHPSHNGVMLAGMWGGSRSRGGKLLDYLMKEMILWPPRDVWDYDQVLLHRVVWPEVTNDILVHDSYHCMNRHFKTEHRAVPYPTKRRGKYYISWGPGKEPEMKYIIPCPVECRPIDHQDWRYC